MGSVTSADAQVSVGIGSAQIDIGINVPVYPELVLVPGYPVYYDARADSNYFFYDGVYWVYQGDNWYASSWYDGPWQMVRPDHVPLYVLRVPVRYYRQPPPYFRGWRADAPPRWGEHWGRGWERRRVGWDRWDHRSAPRPAPLPVYQRQYSGDRYPRAAEQQHSVRSEYYRYRPREAVAREHFQPRGYSDGPRAEPQRYAPGPQRPHDGGRMHGPERRDDGRENRNEERRGYPGGPRAEPQRYAPGPQRPHDGGRMHGPERRDDGQENRNEERRGYPGGPRAEPQQQAPGPQRPHDGGRMHGPEPRDDGRENRNEERGHGRR